MSVIDEAKEWLARPEQIIDDDRLNGDYLDSIDLMEKLIEEIEKRDKVIEAFELRNIHNAVIEPIIYMLHQYEHPPKLEAMTAKEIMECQEGGKDRYLFDPIYHAKVDKLTAVIVSRIEALSQLEES